MSTSTVTSQESGPETADRRLYTAPLVTIRRNGDATTVFLDLPGVDAAGLDISIEEDRLTVTGRKAARSQNGEPVYTEIRDLDYRRVFELAPSIDTTRIGANLKDGVLTLTLPKAEKLKPRKIAVS
ncbi:MAG TPA: Hsp20/alpha crystallin family protein [Chthoniobacterales bacterium]